MTDEERAVFAADFEQLCQRHSVDGQAMFAVLVPDQNGPRIRVLMGGYDAPLDIIADWLRRVQGEIGVRR